MTKKSKKNSSSNNLKILSGTEVILLFIAISLFGGFLLVLDTLKPESSEVMGDSTPAPVDPTVTSFSTDLPSEEPVKAEDHKVAPQDPKSITISPIHLEGFIEKVGIDQNKQIAVPSNVNLAGWYVNSVKPGEKGLSIIDGHVDGRQTTGIFYLIKDLKKNDTFTIEYGDGKKVNFKVVEVTFVDVNKAGSKLFAKKKNIESQLNLITCGGDYDQTSKMYKQRVIVVSERI